MRIYPDGEKWSARMKDIAAPLRQKELDKLDGEYLKRGFRAVGNGRDRNGAYINVEIRPGTDLKRVYEFLNTVDAGAVTLDAWDVPSFLGKGLTSLALKRFMETEGTPECVTLIEPDQLADGIADLRRQATNAQGAEELTDEQRQFITDDLVNEGILTAEEVTAQDAWLEPAPDHVGLKLGNYGASRFDDDLGDFAPDKDLAEWNNDGWGEL